MRNAEHYHDPTAAGAMRKNKVTMPEADEQIAVMRWAEFASGKYPCLEWLFHIPNGGTRHPAEAMQLKRMGVKSGVPDLFLPYPVGGYHGLWVEMKSAVGRPSETQKKWMEYLSSQGYKVVMCRGGQSAINEIRRYITNGKADDPV